jgi:hypothetical protein
MTGGTVAVGPSAALRAGVCGVGDSTTRVFVGDGVADGAGGPSAALRAGVGGAGEGVAVSTEATRVTGGGGELEIGD